MFLCTQSISEHFVFGQNMFLINLIMLLPYRESRMNALLIILAVNCFTLVCHVKLVLLEVVNFAMVSG